MTTEVKGRKPQDHKQKAGTASKDVERLRELDELLADMPELCPPHKLRYRDRARVQEIAAEAVGRGVIVLKDDDEGDGENEGIEFDVRREEDRARLRALHDVVAMIDEFAESIALDPEAYTEWSIGKNEEYFFAILTRYDEAVGESNGS